MKRKINGRLKVLGPPQKCEPDRQVPGVNGSSAHDGSAGPELGEVFAAYGRDLVNFARRWGFNPEDSEDCMQEFFLRLEEKGSLNKFDRSKGQFRSFLLTLFQRFLTNRWHSQRVQRRGGAAPTLPLTGLEEHEAALVDWMTPEKVAHLRWARGVLQQAVETLRQDQARQGKGRLFDALVGHLLHKSAGTSYASLARQVGLSDAATRMTVSRYRERLRVIIRTQIDGNGPKGRHTREELRDLFRMLGS